MKTASLPQWCVAILLSCCLFFATLTWVLFRGRVDAQTNPPCPEVPPYSSVWRPGSTVQIVLDQNSNFSQAEIDAILQAARNWNAANGPSGNNSGVTISVNYTISSTPPSPSTTTPTLHISRGPISSAANVRVETNSNTHPYTSIARMTVKEGIDWGSFPPNFESIIAHEIGHTFGLGDCYPDCNAQSVMGAEPCRYENGPGTPIVGCVRGPTDCDNAKVNEYGKYPPRCQDADNDGITTCDGDTDDTNPDVPLCRNIEEMNPCWQNGGLWNDQTCMCEAHWYYYEPGYYSGGGGPCHHTYSCTDYYTGYSYWDEESQEMVVVESYAGTDCYYQGCY